MKKAPTMFLPLAAMLAIGVATIHAQGSVNMKISGTSANSVINLLQPNTTDDEDNFAGTGTLGSFNIRLVRAISNSPSVMPPIACPDPSNLYLTETAGAGVFRFGDGSLMYVQLTGGYDCIDLNANDAHCTLNFQVSGGTGRFANATGNLKFTETVVPVIADTTGNPVFFAATGKFTGTVSGVSGDQGQDGGQ
jgi:hypothetical protein